MNLHVRIFTLLYSVECSVEYIVWSDLLRPVHPLVVVRGVEVEFPRRHVGVRLCYARRMYEMHV